MQNDCDISVEIAGVRLERPIWNASGVNCTSLDELRELAANDDCGAITSKSCTLLSREGNPRPRKMHFTCGKEANNTINSMGLANHGLSYYIAAAGEVGHRKPYFLSMCPLSESENQQMLSQLQFDTSNDALDGMAGVEMNLSCPNIPGKAQIAYDFEAMDERLRHSFELFDRLPVGVKLPPYFQPCDWDKASEILVSYQDRIRWVTCINSPGNGLVVDPIGEKTLILPKGGLGGIGGGIVKPWALSNVHSFRQRLPDSIDVIGCGGVTSGWDVFEHILCGASAVQVGSLLWVQGHQALGGLTRELTKVMELKGYQRLSDFRGKLKVVEGCAE